LALTAVLCAAPVGGEPDRVERALRKLRQEFLSARNAGDLERAGLKSGTREKFHEARPRSSMPAIEAGVSRVVLESVSMLYRDDGNEWID
jgi:hypothetical protein